MTSIIVVLAKQTENPLPSEYIREISGTTLALVDALQTALTEAGARCVDVAGPGMRSNAHNT